MDPVVDLVVRLSLGLLLAVAATHKLRDPARFRATLADHRVLPAGAVPLVAFAVPVLEGMLAIVLLVGGRLRVPGLLVAAGLLAVYAAVIGVNLARGRRHVDCGCAGPAGRQPISGWLVGRNLVLILAAGVAALPLHARALGWVDVGTVATAVLALAMLYAAGERLLAESARAGVLGGRV